MIVLAVTWQADAGNEKKVMQVFGKLAEASRREPGCRMYVVHQHREDPCRFLVYEQYDDETALQAHRDSPHFQTFAMQELPSLGKRLDGDLYNPLP